MFFIHFYFRLHDAVLDSGQGMVHETQHGEAKPNIPIINSHHFQAVDGDNVEYDREDSLLGHHKEDRRVPVYFQQVKVVLLIITLCKFVYSRDRTNKCLGNLERKKNWGVFLDKCHRIE